MKAPKALYIEELLELFKDRGMVVSDSDIDKIKHINYYKLKEFAHPLSKIKKVNNVVSISYDGVTFQEVLRRYYQDKNLRMYLLHAIEKIEVSIKTTLSHLMGLKYGAFGYLDFRLWVHRKKYKRFEVEARQYKFKKSILWNMKKRSSAEFNAKGNLDSDGFPTIWLTVDILTFGEMVVMIEMMNSSLLSQIADEYNATPEELISWVKCLQFIRNICAHNSNLIDVKLKTKPKFRKEWMEHLYFIESKDGISKTPTNRLAVVICIVIYLVKAINPKYNFGNISKSIAVICNRSEDRANLLGFRTLNDARRISTNIV